MSKSTVLPPTVQRDEAGIRFWDAEYNETPPWSEVRIDGNVLVSFDGEPWKRVDECDIAERAIVIAMRSRHFKEKFLVGLPGLIAEWTDEEVVARLHVRPTEVPFLREANGNWWSIEAAFLLKDYLDTNFTDFFERAEKVPTPGRSLSALRKRAGLGKRRLAREVGVSHKVIALIEADMCHPSQGLMSRLSGALAQTIAAKTEA